MKDRNKRVNKILSYAKGKVLKKNFNRQYIVENGKKTLIKEIETEYDPIEFVMKFDDIPEKENRLDCLQIDDVKDLSTYDLNVTYQQMSLNGETDGEMFLAIKEQIELRNRANY